ncbi:MAG: hypothetical protein IV090_19860 [Candidatus Sericytochromatia bacterium]|nr:hypothetical protein [Candidatus Sericytochromatia bacterium]
MKVTIFHYRNLFNKPLAQFEAEVNNLLEGFDLACEKWAPHRREFQRKAFGITPKVRQMALKIPTDQKGIMGFMSPTDVAVILVKEEIPSNA